MKTIIIDDEPFVLSYMETLCISISLEITATFTNAVDALEYLKANDIDLILLDIEMPGLSGIEAGKEIKQIKPGTGIIFVTGYEQYALQAFQLEAVSYILKPCSAEDLNSAVSRAIKLLPVKSEKKLLIRTFGSFNVSVNGKPLYFSNSKAKELLALLVDRNGGEISLEQATDILWEGRPYDDSVKRLYRKAVTYLNHLFSENNIQFFISNRGSCHIIPEKAECDYFDFLKGRKIAIEQFDGEYMPDYSWAEYTLGRLEQMQHRIP